MPLKLPVQANEPLLSAEEWKILTGSLHLSGRELEIVRYLVEDEKEATIAARLQISCHTVHTHLHRLYEKLDVSSRTELVALLFRQYVAYARRGRFAVRKPFFIRDRAAA
jgi:DNA-binding CsgD family transcriptional regulator